MSNPDEEPPKEPTEDEKRKDLEKKRKELEEKRRVLVGHVDKLEAEGNYAQAGQTYEQLVKISTELNEKDRVKIFEEKAKEMRKQEMAQRKATELEARKDEIESNRDIAIDAGEVALAKGDFNEAVSQFMKVAKYSEELGEPEMVSEYRTKANEIKSQKAELMRKFDMERKIKKLEVERREILRKAEEFIARENYMGSADMYEEASALSTVMKQPERAEIFMTRSKEMREIYEDIRKREEEEKARSEMERVRIDLEDKRARTLARAEGALEKGKFSTAAGAYEQAAKFSLDLGEKEVATGFTAQARDIREKEPELRKEFKEEKRRVVIRRRRSKLLKMADYMLEKEMYLDASSVFKRCAELSKDAGEKDTAKEFQNRSDECRVKEKEKRDELLDRVAKALRAVITLRLMEPKIASEVFSWDELSTGIKVWDVGAVTITFREGEATITRGEAAKPNCKFEGTSENLMKYASGRFNHVGWIKRFGLIRTYGNKNSIKKIDKILRLPPLEREVEKLYSFSGLGFLLATGGLALWMAILFIWPTPAGSILFYQSMLQTVGNLVTAIGHLKAFISDQAILTALYGVWAFLNSPLAIGLLVFVIYLPGLLILVIFVPYYLIFKRYQFEGVKKKRTKEKKRIIRSTIVKQAERAYKKGRFTDASRLWHDAALISVELADEDRAAEYAVRAHALKGQTAELKKKWKVERKREVEDKMRKEMTSRRSTLESERKKVLDDARTAEDDGRLLEASRHYKLASQLSLEIGDKEQARDYQNKSKEGKRREADIRRRSKVEKERIASAAKIDKFENQLKEALEIAEVARGEERWDDAAKHYNLASNFALKMGDRDRAKAYKAQAEELMKRAQLDMKRIDLETQRRAAIIDAEAATSDGNYSVAASLYMKAAKLSEEMGEKEISEGFRATAVDLRKRAKG